jgi:nucleotide-binding universal stress UspA family protein
LWCGLKTIEKAVGSVRRLAMPQSSLQSGDRKIAIAVDLSDESAHAVKWAVAHYLRPGDQVIILHVRPTSVLFGADWGASDQILEADKDAQKKMEEDFDAFTEAKSADLAKPLSDAKIPYKIHIVKDHDLKERICLEIERLGVNAVIMGSRGFGATKRSRKARLGSVSDYCVHHCDCPVVVVRYPEDKADESVGLHPPPPHDVPKVKLRSASGKILSGNLEVDPEPIAVEFSTDSPRAAH